MQQRHLGLITTNHAVDIALLPLFVVHLPLKMDNLEGDPEDAASSNNNRTL